MYDRGQLARTNFLHEKAVFMARMQVRQIVQDTTCCITLHINCLAAMRSSSRESTAFLTVCTTPASFGLFCSSSAAGSVRLCMMQLAV
jgi:hypothetical protein